MSRPLDFEREPHNRARGAAAEEAAVPWLEARGYRIVERNWQSPVGEIDLIAWQDDVLCFIEVKARATGEYGPALDAVDRRKQQRIHRAASLFLAQREIEPPCRFDVVGMDRTGEAWVFTLVADAFQL